MDLTVKDLRVAMRAHNTRREFPCVNDAYNLPRGIGSYHARCACRHIAMDRHGDCNAPINYADAINWAETMLPKGMGYPSQDILPWMESLVRELRLPAIT